MLRSIAFSMILVLAAAMMEPATLAQEPQSASTRKVLIRTPLVYPPLAHRMNLEGTVKMLVTVAPNGSATSVEIRDGHPLPAGAAEIAIHNWKWTPANEQTKELVEITFQRQ